MPLRPSLASTGAVLCGAGYLVIHLVPAPVTLARHLTHPYRWIAEYGPDAAVTSVAGALLWVCALWVVVGLAAIHLSTLPGLAGRCGRAVASHVLPAAIRRLVLASAGASLLFSPLSAAAVGGQGAAASEAGAANATAAPAAPAPFWPIDQVSVTPAPSWPIDQPSAPAGSNRTPQRSPASATASSAQPPAEVAPAATVIVTSGDSLWTIAAAKLGPAATDRQIAVAWPYWYRANRAVIGRDPGLIQPGTELSVPAAQSTPGR
jgi:resuscitation-promoting factor RpfA